MTDASISSHDPTVAGHDHAELDSGDARGETSAPDIDIDLDAIETDLNRVERALEQMADGTYFEAGGADSVGSNEPA